MSSLHDRYDTDPLFRTLVDRTSAGYADDDGRLHDGPTIGDAIRVERFLEHIDAAGYQITPKASV